MNNEKEQTEDFDKFLKELTHTKSIPIQYKYNEKLYFVEELFAYWLRNIYEVHSKKLSHDDMSDFRIDAHVKQGATLTKEMRHYVLGKIEVWKLQDGKWILEHSGYNVETARKIYNALP